MTPTAYRDACLKAIGDLRDGLCEQVLAVTEGEDPQGEPTVTARAGAQSFAEYQALIAAIKAYTLCRKIMLAQFRQLFELPQPGGESDGAATADSATAAAERQRGVY